MARVLIAGADWQFRALVRAQLLEEGIEVEAYETVRDALNGLRDLNALPALLVIDLLASPNPRAELRLLAKWARLLPVWILIGHQLAVGKETGEAGAERVLYRPVEVGELVKAIKQRIGW
ncbi:MAG: hypothetical protein ACRD2B_03260 [Terriglobia bacterium]